MSNSTIEELRKDIEEIKERLARIETDVSWIKEQIKNPKFKVLNSERLFWIIIVIILALTGNLDKLQYLVQVFKP